MSLEKLVWGEPIVKEFPIEIKGKEHKIVLRSLNTEDSIAMDLAITDRENPKVKEILADAVEMLSRSIVSIDGNVPDSPEETKKFLRGKTEATDIFKILEKFQSLSEVASTAAKN